MRALLLVALSLTPLLPAQLPQLRLTALGARVPELERQAVTLGKQVVVEGDEAATQVRRAWHALTCSGLGSNMRMGPLKGQLKESVRDLRGAWKATGAFFAEGADDRPRRELLATVAMACAYRDGDYKLLKQAALAGADAAIAHYGQDGVVADDEELALLAVLAEVLRDAGEDAQCGRLRELLTRLAQRLPNKEAPRAQAALHLVTLVVGAESPPELTIAKCWPRDLAEDPLHTWIAAYASRRLPDAVKKAQRPRVAQLLRQRDQTGGWAPAGGCDAFTTTAMLCSAVGMLQVAPARAEPAEKDDGHAFR